MVILERQGVFLSKAIVVVGLGYVGLPLALAFGRVMPTLGFELSQQKIDAYNEGYDPTGEMERSLFSQAKYLSYSNNTQDIKQADFVVIAVPTPVDRAHQPDLTAVKNATAMVGQNLKQGAIVIFESTVYPGVTEDVCVPILEKESGLKCGAGFKVGYSPERVNPGDKVHRLETIVKVVSGQDEDTLEQIAQLYEQVIEAGVYRAPTIKVAEAAKVIENTQRDLNIALMNELAVIFDKMDIDTQDVLDAAGSKWNFLPFKPGLVGGHCIGVDPYYLTYKAEMMGYQPDVILAGRQINDGMGKFIAGVTIKKMIDADCKVKGANVLVLGITFKENCEDIRNSRVIDVIEELQSFGICVQVFDPVANADEVEKTYGFELAQWEDIDAVQAIVAAVPHNEIVNINVAGLAKKGKAGMPFLDVKSAFVKPTLEQAGFTVWRL